MTCSKLSGSAENSYFWTLQQVQVHHLPLEKKYEIEILRKMTDDGLGLELKN